MDGRLTPLIIDNTAVKVSIRADAAFDYDLEEIVFNGIPVQCIFDIKLYHHIRYWFDKELASLTIHHVLTYDNLKDVFIIEKSTKNTAPAEVDDLKEAESLVSSIEDLTITTQEFLDTKEKYYIVPKCHNIDNPSLMVKNVTTSITSSLMLRSVMTSITKKINPSLRVYS